MMQELASIEIADEPSEETKSGLSLLLVSRREHQVYNSVGHRLPALQKKRPYNPAYLNPDDAKALKVSPGDRIDIRSASNHVVGIVELADDVRQGVISVCHGFPNRLHDDKTSFIGTSTSKLIDDEVDFDRFSGMPRMSAIPVVVSAA
jgi:anaerobic selenocysteine-containing dehydrogenase